MKEKFLECTLSLILSTHPDCDEQELSELRFGLEGLYLSVTKLIIIFALAILLGILKEMLILLIIFNILRTTGFGLHATKSWACLLSSSSIFLILPFLAKVIILPFYIKLVFGILGIGLIYKYAPADTHKRPLIRKSRREKYKFITTISCIVLVTIMLYGCSNEMFSNLILFGIYTEIFMIHPFIYKIFHLPYDNYKTYHLKLD